jgi:hypothetical protein
MAGGRNAMRVARQSIVPRDGAIARFIPVVHAAGEPPLLRWRLVSHAAGRRESAALQWFWDFRGFLRIL